MSRQSPEVHVIFNSLYALFLHGTCLIFFGDSGKKAMTCYEITKSLIDF